MREGIHGEGPDGEEIRLDEKVSPKATPADALRDIQARLAEKNMSEEELEKLFEDPIDFFATRIGSAASAMDIVLTVAKLYFRTLHIKALEGEVFNEARVHSALRMARARTLEALADRVQHVQDMPTILRVAELVSKD